MTATHSPSLSTTRLQTAPYIVFLNMSLTRSLIWLHNIGFDGKPAGKENSEGSATTENFPHKKRILSHWKYAAVLKLTAVPSLFHVNTRKMYELREYDRTKGSLWSHDYKIKSIFQWPPKTYKETTLLKQKHSNKSWPSVSHPGIAVLAYFTADSTTLPVESQLLVVGHQRQGCLLALAALL